MRISGCRINEILAIRYCDVIDSQTVFVRGLKRSASKQIHAPELESFFSKKVFNQNEFIFRVSYMTIYRECLRRGIFEKHPNNLNRSVTHSLRYKRIRALQVVAPDVKAVSDCIGHRSQSTTKRYLDKGVYHG
jgi:integrase